MQEKFPWMKPVQSAPTLFEQVGRVALAAIVAAEFDEEAIRGSQLGKQRLACFLAGFAEVEHMRV